MRERVLRRPLGVERDDVLEAVKVGGWVVTRVAGRASILLHSITKKGRIFGCPKAPWDPLYHANFGFLRRRAQFGGTQSGEYWPGPALRENYGAACVGSSSTR